MTLAAVDLNTLLTTVGMIAALIVALLKHLGKQAEAKKVEAMVEAIEEVGSANTKRKVRDKATSLGVEILLSEDVERLTRRFKKIPDGPPIAEKPRPFRPAAPPGPPPK